MIQPSEINLIRDIIEEATSKGLCTCDEMWKCFETLNKLGGLK